MANRSPSTRAIRTPSSEKAESLMGRMSKHLVADAIAAEAVDILQTIHVEGKKSYPPPGTPRSTENDAGMELQAMTPDQTRQLVPVHSRTRRRALLIGVFRLVRRRPAATSGRHAKSDEGITPRTSPGSSLALPLPTDRPASSQATPANASSSALMGPPAWMLQASSAPPVAAVATQRPSNTVVQPSEHVAMLIAAKDTVISDPGALSRLSSCVLDSAEEPRVHGYISRATSPSYPLSPLARIAHPTQLWGSRPASMTSAYQAHDHSQVERMTRTCLP